MSIKILVSASLLFVISMLSSCQREKITPTTTADPPASIQKLFLVGYTGPGALTKPAYWENGVITKLSDSYGEAFALASPDSTKVFAIGYLNTSISQSSQWRNGALSLLDGFANDVAAVGDDVYVAGTASNEAAYWKNGNKTLVTHGLGVIAQAYRILVENNNVHIGINVLNNDLFSYTSIYWKNGVSKTLSSSTTFGDMTISGSDVFILGTNGDGTGVVWKNGVVIATFGGRVSSGGKNYLYSASGITVLNGTIYVSGIVNDFQTSSPCYWKINVADKTVSAPIILPYDYSPQYVYFTSIGAVGNDIYISGNDDGAHKSLLWKNGTLIAPFDGSTSTDTFFIKRISVVSR